MEESIFTKIIKRQIPAEIVYENDIVIAFLDIKPVNPGHTLVVIKRQVPNFLENTKEELSAAMEVAQKISKALLSWEDVVGVNLMMNVNEGAGQKVFHTHFHIIPRYSGDGLKHWPQFEYKSLDEQREYADKLRDLLIVPQKYKDKHPLKPEK